MKKLQSDVLIVGAGLNGLMTAFTLSDLGIKIIIIDKVDFLSLKNNNTDLRTTAIAEGSKQFFEKIGIWKKIKKFSEPIRDIKVIDRKPHRKINFSNQNNLQNLGYIVRNSILKSILLKSLKTKNTVKIIGNQSLENIKNENFFIKSSFNNIIIESKLLIAADGKNSRVRKLLKTPIYKKNYHQKALVVNFHHTKSHNCCAFELFLKSGPLAILPMKKTKKNFFSSSLVWSHKPEYINNLFRIDKKLLMSILEEKIKNYIGSINEIVDVQSFDLNAHINSRFYEERVIYLGDSAHSIHPIAGQGWNLGVRDIERCLNALKENISLGLECGSMFTCKKYHENSYQDAYALFQLTDKLNTIFAKDSLLSNLFRETGFKIINKNHNIKKIITEFAMGFNLKIF